MADPTKMKAMKRDLQEILGEGRVSDNPQMLAQHGQDESYHPVKQPDVVVFPKTTDEVRQVIEYAHHSRIPIVPFGAGTSLEGHIIPQKGGITLDFSQMNRILEVRPEDFLVRVQPGVTKNQLNEVLKRHGLFFPVDPGADATLGGMAATNASGTTTVRYGVMRDQVLSLEVVLSGGKVIHTGTLARKSSAGYNLTGLFVGSEGTLGVITELTIRLHGLPESVMAVRATFSSLADAVATAIAIQGAGIPVARMELVDETTLRAVNRYSKTAYAEVPTLLLEFHGNEAGLRQDARFAQEVVSAQGGQNFQAELDEQARQVLWEARHMAALAVMAQHPGKRMMVTDVCVPPSQLPRSIQKAKQFLREANKEGAIFGHIGDGNYHVVTAVDVADVQDVARSTRFNAQLVEDALASGGTCTGEHGIGIGKRSYLVKEHGEAMDVMRTIKRALDPLNLMNPGKVIEMID